METAFRRAQVPYEVVFAPWKREQATVQQGIAFMAPLTRLESRERLYQWVAPVNISYLELVTVNPALAGLAIEELLDHPIAARMESPAEFSARRLGFKAITLVEDEDVAAKLISAGRVSLWMQRGLPGDWAYRRAGRDPAELYRIKRWTTPVQYLVASPRVPREVVNRLRSTLEDMRESGEIDCIKQSFFEEKLDCELLIGCASSQGRIIPHP